MAMCSGLETVLLLLRGLTGSYSQRRPLSRQRSQEGRSSLHFFFFSLLCDMSVLSRGLVGIRTRQNLPMHAA